MVRAVVEVSGCCTRYRAQMTIKPTTDSVITADALGPTGIAAYEKLMQMVERLNIEGLDARSIQPRRWPDRERKPTQKAASAPEGEATAEAAPPESSPVSAPTTKGTSKQKPASGDGEGDDNIKEGGDENL